MKKVLRKSSLPACVLIFLAVSLGIVFAGDVTVKEGSLDVTGSATLGDATTDYHAINATPGANNMLTASFSETVANSTNYFIKGTTTSSGNVSSETDRYNYGYYLDQDISGTINRFPPGLPQQYIYGTYIDLDSTSTIGIRRGQQHLYGNYADILFDGTLSGSQNIHFDAYGAWYDVTGKTGGAGTTGNKIYGISANANGDLGTTGDAEHYGAQLVASGTADTNYGVHITCSGATTNWGLYEATQTDNVLYGNTRIGSTAAPTAALDVTGDVKVSDNSTLGDASTDTITHTGRMIVRSVNDDSMDATAGTQAEIVFNTDDSKFYGCTVTGDPATWAALN